MVCQCILDTFGWAMLAFIAYRFTTVLYNIFYPYFIAQPINLKKAAGGKWAVITGGSDGIGKAYAFELARQGFNILLISRTQSKLDEIKEQIERDCGVQVDTVAFNFSETSVDQYDDLIFTKLRETDVGILVNNVGVSFNFPSNIHEVEDGMQKLADVNIVNTLPTTLMTAAVLPQMIERNSGVIINIASSVAYSPVCMLSVYSAAKKYVTWLTSILSKEYADTNIIFQSVCPMIVATKMSKVSRPSFFIVKAESYAKSAIRTIGVMGDTAGCFSHQIQVEFIRNLPQFFIVPYLSGKAKLIRKKALLKKLSAEKSS